MKLYYSPTSPFARKVRIVAREHGLIDRIEEIAEDGLPLTDSPLICDYLDRMVPRPAPSR